ncbi:MULTISPECIES: hypothetical protein [Methylobacteriaceae]|nr:MULTISPECIES: hypothetical protein [Methylobacteriaceae]PXW63641.1 hypothetical protein BY998_10518 [Methylobacterium sp. B4]UYW30342.1 hypothetical protein OKB92_15155 [Methylorubrum extorquens]
MRIIAARVMAIAVMLLVLGTARWLEQFGTPSVIEAYLAAAAAATAVAIFARR